MCRKHASLQEVATLSGNAVAAWAPGKIKRLNGAAMKLIDAKVCACLFLRLNLQGLLAPEVLACVEPIDRLLGNHAHRLIRDSCFDDVFEFVGSQIGPEST